MSITTVTAGDQILASKINELISQINQNETDITSNLNAILDLSSLNFEKNFGEAVDGSTIPQAVCLLQTTGTQLFINQTDDDTTDIIEGNDHVGQSFTMPANLNRLTKISVSLRRFNSPSGNFTLNVYATSAGVPTGASLGSVTLTASDIESSAYRDHDFIFSSPVAVSPSTQYCYMLELETDSSPNQIGVEVETGSDPISGGTRVTSSDGGSSHSTASGDLKTKIYGSYVAADNDVYNAEADNLALVDFKGFCKANVSGSTDGKVYFGVVDGFSGLTEGSYYYLTNTPGQISTTPGDIKICVGKAVSATEIDTLDRTESTFNGVYDYTPIDATDLFSNNKLFIPHNLGRVPKRVRVKYHHENLPEFSGEGVYNGSDYSCIYYFQSGNPNPEAATRDDKIIWLDSEINTTTNWGAEVEEMSNSAVVINCSDFDTTDPSVLMVEIF